MRQLLIAATVIALFSNCNSSPKRTSPGRVDSTKVTKHQEHPLLSSVIDMVNDVHAYKSQNDADLDFAAIMAIHHDAGVEMTSFEMNSGMSRELMDLALRMKNRLELEDRLIDDMMKGYVPVTNGNSDFYRDARNIIENMQENLLAKEITGSNDKDYVNFMVTHNLQGGEICNTYLLLGRNEKLKALARDMITKSKKEIIEMQDILSRSEKPAE